MKLLAVAHNSDFSGGANRSLFMVLRRLKRDYGVQIRVLVPKNKGILVDKLTEAGIPWDCIPYYGVITGIRGDGKDLLRKAKVWAGVLLETAEGRKLAKTYAREKFDLVYTNTRLPLIGAVIARQLKIPHVCHVREFGPVQPYWPKWTCRHIYEQSDRIILISRALQAEFEKYVPADKLITIHNGIDSPLGLPMADYGNHDGFHLLLTGRLVPDKGHMDAIGALKQLADRGCQDIRLHFAGSVPNGLLNGEYLEKLRAEIARAGLEDKVFFHGEVENMTALRQEMDVELMCAICETFGRVTVEGMRSGLLLIGSDTGGTLEIMEDGLTGLLYRQGDAASLAEKILFAYEHRQEAGALARAGYDAMQRKFTPQWNVEEIFHVLQEAAEKKS